MKHKTTSEFSNWKFRQLSTHLLLSLSLAVNSGAAGAYDALPLRPNVLKEDYYHTELGRDKKRESDAPVNAYRLYAARARPRAALSSSTEPSVSMRTEVFEMRLENNKSVSPESPRPVMMLTGENGR